MGAAQDIPAGKRNPQVNAEGGEEMTNAQLDAIRGEETMRIWEDMDADNQRAKRAVDQLTKAVEMFRQVEKLINDAAQIVDGTPEQNRIESLNIDVEALEIAVLMQIERMR